MPKSPIMEMFLERFKAAAAEGAAVELKLRVLAGKVPGLEKYAHEKHLRDIEDDIAKHFGTALAAEEKETLTLCRVLRNKLLHSDFYAMREKLRQSGAGPGAGGVIKVDLPVATIKKSRRDLPA